MLLQAVHTLSQCLSTTLSTLKLVTPQANDCMSKIRTVGHRIMAAKSELGMTKTRNEQLSVRCSELVSSFSTAQARLAAGQAPTSAAERELARLLGLDAAHASQQVGCLTNLLCIIQACYGGSLRGASCGGPATVDAESSTLSVRAGK